MFKAVVSALLAVCLSVCPALSETSQAQVPLESYGDLPVIRLMAISPQGKQIAFVGRANGQDILFTHDLATKANQPQFVIDAEAAPRSIRFVDEEYIVLIASRAARTYSQQSQYEYSRAYSFNLNTKRLEMLLEGGVDNLYQAQSGLGNIVGRETKRPGRVLMPAYMGRTDPTLDLMSVDLKTGSAKRGITGRGQTMDWFVAEDGTLLAREDYSNERDLYEIYSEASGSMKRIFQLSTPRPPFSLVGVKPDESALLIVGDSDETEGFGALFEMTFDGEISAPVLGRKDANVEEIFTSMNRVVYGVKYSGMVPSYDFYDPKVDAAVKATTDQLPGYAVHLIDWSDDWSKLLYLIYGPNTAGSYVLQDVATNSLSVIAAARDSVPGNAVANVSTFEYAARDGLKIPALLTWPTGAAAGQGTNLPLIVMPHGGPASYDSLGFDWMAQYFASRGYLVLQPNFRGSDGFGADFENAGHGEWGRKMQDDITDGVQLLVNDKVADGTRVCIVGASYGGYAALAGGAFTPDLYKCVVAIAPVADLRSFISGIKDRRGRDHWALDYWQELIGDPQADMSALDAVSPAKFASAFTAPVLLIHGQQDTVVPIAQSEQMAEALRDAGRKVSFVRMKSEDHWLSFGESRLETLRAMSQFVENQIGEKAAAD